MKELIEGFAAQLNEALNIAANAKLSAPAKEIRNVVIAGMGGSGIGGNLVQAFTADTIKVPISISKSYDVPAFISEHTLFIACSFSGNTEETLDALEKAGKKGAKVVCITSGGKMGAWAAANGADIISIPGVSNSPRASIGYSYVQILKVLNFYGLNSTDYAVQVKAAAYLLSAENSTIKSEALALAEAMKGKLPILYGDTKFEAVLVRTQQQIAENSKQLSHVNVLPEMNHNELVGWMYAKEIFGNSVTVLLRSSFDHPRTAKRMDICKPIFAKVSPNVIELKAKGNSLVEQSIYFIYLLDWVSFYLAEINNVDPFPVEVINFLKDELAKVS